MSVFCFNYISCGSNLSLFKEQYYIHVFVWNKLPIKFPD